MLIYFNRALQDRVHRLFYQSLVRFGFLGLGAKETVQLHAPRGARTEDARRAHLPQGGVMYPRSRRRADGDRPDRARRRRRPKVNILLVDDRPDKLLALESILADLGQNLVRAYSGREALRALLQQDFAVILLDVNMPGMDGFETAAMIRAARSARSRRPSSSSPPCDETRAHVFRSYSLGAVDFIRTPVVPEILKAKVAVFVDLYKKTEQVKRQARADAPAAGARARSTQLAEAADRLEAETKRNRFFTLALDMLAIADFDGTLQAAQPELGARPWASATRS